MGSERVNKLFRLDPVVARDLDKLAEEADISVNQLVGGILRWAVKNAHPGRPQYIEDTGCIERTSPELGCVWFGREPYETTDKDGEPEFIWGVDYFSLDFSEKGALTDDAEVRAKEERRNRDAGTEQGDRN